MNRLTDFLLVVRTISKSRQKLSHAKNQVTRIIVWEHRLRRSLSFCRGLRVPCRGSRVTYIFFWFFFFKCHKSKESWIQGLSTPFYMTIQYIWMCICTLYFLCHNIQTKSPVGKRFSSSYRRFQLPVNQNSKFWETSKFTRPLGNVLAPLRKHLKRNKVSNAYGHFVFCSFENQNGW